MKKIIFVVINMNVGGTEKALLNLVNEFPRKKYEITIFMLEKYGGFLKYIPQEVNIHYFSDYYSIKDLLNNPPRYTFIDLLKKGKIFRAFMIIILHIITKVLKDRSLYFKYLLRKYPTLNEEYDIAVAYDGPMDFISYFVLKKVKARKKLQWIHFDVSKIGFNLRFTSKIYSKFDRVFVVSNEAKTKLLKYLPNLKGKTEVLFNIISPLTIKKQSTMGLGFTDNFEGLRILTVGRLSKEKGQDLIVPVLARLIQEGHKVRWYCLGDGNLKHDLENLIKDYKLEDHFILLGSDPNPYPYINQCDIYVQPSRHEGFCITLAEARCLRKPIVTTNFTGAKEQISNEVNGLIVDVSENCIYEGLLKLLENKDLRKTFSQNLLQQDFDNENEIKNY
ncbi:glycosyltransferase [Bacillus timonensis]|uniref:glycosyltransferase n=1 Tax=Bacillus timonensis TaxID=1033734 RepID=UPI000288C402